MKKNKLKDGTLVHAFCTMTGVELIGEIVRYQARGRGRYGVPEGYFVLDDSGFDYFFFPYEVRVLSKLEKEMR